MMFTDNLLIAQTAAPAAETPAAQTGGGGNLLGILGPVLIFGVMIFLLFRSQKKEARRRQEMLNTIKAGDKVVTAGGIYGEVTTVKNDSFVVKIADNVKIEVCKTGVTSVVNSAAPAEDKANNYDKDGKQ